MRLHILAGCRELLRPEILEPELAASLIGPQVRIATAFWLSPKCGQRYHGFLQDEPGDRRTKVMASALRDEFGDRFEPLLVLPDLLDEFESKRSTSSLKSATTRSQQTVLSEILTYGNVGQVRLYGLALPAEAGSEDSWENPGGLVTDKVRQRIGRLCTNIVAQTGAEDVDTEVIEASPDSSVFETLYRNAICNQIALRLTSRLHEQGWNSDVETLAAAISDTFSNWQKKGVVPHSPMHGKKLDAMTEIIHKKWF